MLVLWFTYNFTVQIPESVSVVEVPEFPNDSWHRQQGVTGEASQVRQTY